MPSDIPRREDGSIDTWAWIQQYDNGEDYDVVNEALQRLLAATWNDGNANQDTLAVNPYEQEAGEDE